MSLSQALKAYESVIESTGKEGARILLASYVIMDLVMKEASFDNPILFRFCSFRFSRMLADAYEWDNRREDGRIPKDILLQFRETAHKVTDCYLKTKREVTFRSFLKSIGVAGIGAVLSPEERGDLSQFILIFNELVNRHHDEYADSITTDINITIEHLDCSEIRGELDQFATMAADGLKQAYLRAQNEQS
jgi:hypothetical protein